jgi:hypothetical protein
VDSFKQRPLYSQYPLDRKLGGAQSRSGRCGEDKSLVATGNRTQAFQPVARHYTDSMLVLHGNTYCSVEAESGPGLLSCAPLPIKKTYSTTFRR